MLSFLVQTLSSVVREVLMVSMVEGNADNIVVLVEVGFLKIECQDRMS